MLVISVYVSFLQLVGIESWTAVAIIHKTLTPWCLGGFGDFCKKNNSFRLL